MVEQLTIFHIQYIVFRLVEQYRQWAEPIPGFHTRYPGILESCLTQPFQAFGGKDLYPELVDKAVILFYLLIKNHPFENGNKRLAVFSLFLFLNINNWDLKIAPDELYNLALKVAASKQLDKELAVKEITDVLSKNIIELPTI